jgi:hypothetical protein
VRDSHRERGSLGAGCGPASLEVNNSASDTNHTMDPMRVLVMWLSTVWGLGAVRMVAAPVPPSSPASVSQPGFVVRPGIRLLLRGASRATSWYRARRCCAVW